MVSNKKRKIVMAITIGLSCFILSVVMFMQFKVVNETDITSIENMRETELRTELSNWKAKYEEVDGRYEEVTKTIEEYKNKEKSDNETTELLESELEEIRKALGKTDVIGTGIEITLKETENADTSIKADDLLVTVNALKLAGAEAISINEERIINMSDIVEINESFIKINGQRILAPYVIKAIGDSAYLESSLLGNGGYVEELRKSEYDVKIERKNKVNIPKYKDDINTKYIK